MKRLILIAAIAALAAFALASLTGCSSNPAKVDPELSEAGRIVLRIAVRRGVSDYIQKQGPSAQLARAVRIKRIVDDIFLVASGDQAVTIADLKAAALAKISPELTPLEQADARDLIELVGNAVQNRIGPNQLDAGALVIVRDFLGLIVEATSFYAPPS